MIIESTSYTTYWINLNQIQCIECSYGEDKYKIVFSNITITVYYGTYKKIIKAMKNKGLLKEVKENER